MSLLSKLRHAPRNIALLLVLAALVCSNAAYSQVSFNLSQGWNLLGNSSATSIDVATAFGDASKFTTVWKWNSTGGNWAFYAPSMTSTNLASYAQGKGYEVLTSIAPKEGFWVNAATTATLTGPVANGVTLAEGDLLTGWNLLGSADKVTPSQLNQGLSVSLGAKGKSMTTAWAWDAQGAAWRFYAPSLEANGTLADYISSKQYQPFSAALSESEGFWLNIGTITATTNAAFVSAPVVNTPLDGVTVTLTCASGAIGGKGIASKGDASIAIDPTTCAAPYTMAVAGQGTMAGPDLVFGTDDDEVYDSNKRTALKSVVQTADLSAPPSPGTSVSAPSITSLTTMIAETVAKANPTPTEIDAAKTTVAGVTGIATTDLYKNPMTNGDVFKAATLVNELVASGMKADTTQTPAALIKAMAANTMAKLTDATIDPAKLFGLSTANAAIMQAQMSTMQAKADAMKIVADAVAANVASADQTFLLPADAAKAMTAALAGTQGSDAATAIAKAKMAQDTMKQMFVDMDALRKDTVDTSSLPARMAAMVQGLEAVRVEQDASIQASIVAAGGDATKIAEAIKQASGMIIGAAPALMTTVTGATLANLQTSGYMAGAAASIASQIDPTKIAAAVAAAGGDASKIDFTNVVMAGVDPTKIATTATTAGAAASSLALTPPSALAGYPALAGQVVGMVISRATMTNQLASANLQAWVNAIGTALAVNSPTLLNPGSVVDAFAKLQPDLAAVPGTITMTLAAGPTFTPTGTGGTTLPMCSTLGLSAQPSINCTPDTGGTQTLAQFCAAANIPSGSGYTFPSTMPTYGGMTCP